ncbi:MAG: hypothetical protein OEV41_10560 [Gammaproteobacteria bacterium]|nr:hypothetical protein [Gammaproteobacteria bacterium]MDH5345836.1 hypothetical protein [Gammaproteobacteria bacterium]
MIRQTTNEPRSQTSLESTPFHRYVFDDGTVWTEFHRSKVGYLLRFPGLADFEVSADGTEVAAWPAEDTDEATIEHLYINQLVPLAMSRQGRPAFHASVVTVTGGAVALLGSAGAGKSTLAASFALGEAGFLTDDALLVEERDDGFYAIPSHPSLRLWADSVEALVGEPESLAGAICYSTKARLLAGEALAHDVEPRRLLAAFRLGGNSEFVTIKPLAGSDRYRAWLDNSFLLDIEDRDLLAQHFDWTHRISGAVPTFTLDYPRDFCMLPEVRDAIRRHVRKTGS